MGIKNGIHKYNQQNYNITFYGSIVGLAIYVMSCGFAVVQLGSTWETYPFDDGNIMGPKLGYS